MRTSHQLHPLAASARVGASLPYEGGIDAFLSGRCVSGTAVHRWWPSGLSRGMHKLLIPSPAAGGHESLFVGSDRGLCSVA